jgi:hypothetical protein
LKYGLYLILAVTVCLAAEPDPPALASVRRIYVDRLTGDESAAQIRDMIINALQSANRFVITENPDRADVALKGSAADQVFTDTFQSSESIDARAALGAGTGATKAAASRRGTLSIGVGQDESTKINERKHEAMAAVRLITKDGDVIWATTQESLGAKFRGASADVADKVVKQLIADMEKSRQSPPAASTGPGVSR